MANNLKISLTIFLIYVLPVILIVHSGMLFGWRLIILGIFWLGAIIHSRFYHRNLHLGLRLDNLGNAVLLNLFAIAIALPFILVVANNFQNEIFYRHVSQSLATFGFYMAISSPFQEFIYRGMLFAKLRKITKSPVLQILLSSSLFSFLHLIYGNEILIILSFLGGILWGWAYHRFPNLYAVSFSHAVIGSVAMYLRLI